MKKLEYGAEMTYNIAMGESMQAVGSVQVDTKFSFLLGWLSISAWLRSRNSKASQSTGGLIDLELSFNLWLDRWMYLLRLQSWPLAFKCRSSRVFNSTVWCMTYDYRTDCAVSCIDRGHCGMMRNETYIKNPRYPTDICKLFGQWRDEGIIHDKFPLVGSVESRDVKEQRKWWPTSLQFKSLFEDTLSPSILIYTWWNDSALSSKMYFIWLTIRTGTESGHTVKFVGSWIRPTLTPESAVVSNLRNMWYETEFLTSVGEWIISFWNLECQGIEGWMQSKDPWGGKLGHHLYARAPSSLTIDQMVEHVVLMEPVPVSTKGQQLLRSDTNQLLK